MRGCKGIAGRKRRKVERAPDVDERFRVPARNILSIRDANVCT